jgi:hypothetical protein
MMLRLFLASALAATPGLSETLLSGATYFDSENTLLEVQQLIKEENQDGLVRLFQGNHISAKLAQNLDIILLRSGLDPESPAEFRFANNPTTYWTFSKYVSNDVKTTSASPTPTRGLPGETGFGFTPTTGPTPTPASTPSPASTPALMPTPTPKSRIVEREDTSDTETSPPLRKHPRAKKHPPSNDDEGVPESAKVWHQVNGHWKWYDKRNQKEVRRAIAVEPNVPTAAPIPNR